MRWLERKTFDSVHQTGLAEVDCIDVFLTLASQASQAEFVTKRFFVDRRQQPGARSIATPMIVSVISSLIGFATEGTESTEMAFEAAFRTGTTTRIPLCFL
ncbi:hypothetical protein CEE69_02995 [Rhodopirellula bahusiensis]|uniref:Uncharacterized protein n=1 Tax=Rhodopirellula bahusiensis TaxID=2014065 RepID=A0A2G1WBK4_9BACT|nr:hypothetical protein CEE69_02995 [Rhodopirellula bahusiensis]